MPKEHTIIPVLATKPTEMGIKPIIIALPDATGTSSALEKLCRQLCSEDTGAVYRIDDARIPYDQKFMDLSANCAVSCLELVKTYIVTIYHMVKDFSSKNPIILLGYSGGGILANSIEFVLKQGNNQDEPDIKVFHAINFLTTRNIIPIYIDSLAPQMLKKMSKLDFMEHMIEVIEKVAGNFPSLTLNLKFCHNEILLNNIIPNSTEFRRQLLQNLLDEKLPELECDGVVFMKTFLEFISQAMSLAPLKPLNKNTLNTLKDMQEMSNLLIRINVLLANHNMYLDQDDSYSSTIQWGRFIVTQSTAAFSKAKLGGDDKLGYKVAETVSVQQIGEDHYSVLTEPTAITALKGQIPMGRDLTDITFKIELAKLASSYPTRVQKSDSFNSNSPNLPEHTEPSSPRKTTTVSPPRSPGKKPSCETYVLVMKEIETNMEDKVEANLGNSSPPSSSSDSIFLATNMSDCSPLPVSMPAPISYGWFWNIISTSGRNVNPPSRKLQQPELSDSASRV